ncbi:hypothetical protein PM082_009637 [Marasmius tenuissimus]|nr:hypothetical protein PM082_009637 [Marasmius tenuissimus]
MPSLAAKPGAGDKHFVEEQYKYGIVLPIIISSIQLFLYGLNVLLFRVGLVVLRRREREIVDGGHHLFRISLISLLVSSSVGAPVGLVYQILITRVALCHIVSLECSLVEVTIALRAISICQVAIAWFMSFIVDMILVFRCFIICGWRIKQYAFALVVGCLVLDSTAAMLMIYSIGRSLSLPIGFLETPDTDTPSGVWLPMDFGVACASVHVLINMVLTAIIVSKILRSKNVYMSSGSQNTPKRFHTVARLLTESCSLYLVTWVVFIACAIPRGGVELTPIFIQVVGIGPTLLFVRGNINKAQEEGDVVSNAQSTSTTSSTLPDEGIVLQISRNTDQ